MGEPSAWLQRHIALLPAGLVLDLACGGGRNSLFLLEKNYEVLALDRDGQGFVMLEAAGARTMLHDLEAEVEHDNWPFVENAFEAIVVCNYLHRPLFPAMLGSLAPGGVLIYETFAAGNEQFGKPSNPAFLLQQGELLAQIRSNAQVAMHVIAYEEGYVEQPKPAMIQRICARKIGKTRGLDRL
ncbi:class I SAM-dependent methyltransferase [Undibacterium sp. CY18W]|uniref:Class I SAM-dependent methyltransferase n=1 Tax=Undibacterium hunanense TaxID=2762292 RepID=A0ABR6ZKC8_9BURK|nr:class I SAM-dependent methyltransferase [Undibacterium hunanense]MBC3916355.1 class I SAM-dependent methyltransferase [Undibacterium hunanense]